MVKLRCIIIIIIIWNTKNITGETDLFLATVDDRTYTGEEERLLSLRELFEKLVPVAVTRDEKPYIPDISTTIIRCSGRTTTNRSSTKNSK